MIFKQIRWSSDKDITPTHEEIPQEELWEDGELNKAQVKHKMAYQVLDEGDWILVRRINK